MEIYTLNENFQREELIDEFYSFIWTERYLTPGDFTLVVPRTQEMIDTLYEGAFVSIPASKDVGIIENVLAEGQVLTITGEFLAGFLKNRLVRRYGYQQISGTPNEWRITAQRPGWIMGEIVQQMCVAGYINQTNPVVPWGHLEVIPNLTVGTRVSGDNLAEYVIEYGTVLEALNKLASEYKIGYRLYLDSATPPSSYSLKFDTYRGLDRTRSQTTNDVVVFSSAYDQMLNAKELRSIAGYKNVAYVFLGDPPSAWVPAVPWGEAFAEPSGSTLGFKRRTMQRILTKDEMPAWQASAKGTSQTKALLDQMARDELINNNYVRLADGEIVPQSDYIYGTHYGLGDIIELEGPTGLTGKAQITEFIYTQDATGERAYPTLASV